MAVVKSWLLGPAVYLKRLKMGSKTLPNLRRFFLLAALSSVAEGASRAALNMAGRCTEMVQLRCRPRGAGSSSFRSRRGPSSAALLRSRNRLARPTVADEVQLRLRPCLTPSEMAGTAAVVSWPESAWLSRSDGWLRSATSGVAGETERTGVK